VSRRVFAESQCVAVCCRVLPCVAVYGDVWQCVAVCCGIFCLSAFHESCSLQT